MSLFQFVQFFGLLTMAAGKPIFLPRQASGAPQDGARNLIDVQLYSLGNSTVKASIINVGDERLRIVKRGGLLDDGLPTKKVAVSGAGGNPTFTGAEVDYVNTHLSPEAFVHLAPNQTIDSVFDIADSHGLSPGKVYSAIADGMLEYTKSDNPKKFFFVPYKSNAIEFDAPENADNRLVTRATLTGCTGEYNKLMQDNLARVAEMANKAAADARNGTSAHFKKFFMSDSQADRKEVAERLEAIAKEATTKGTLTYYCQASAQDSCGGNVAAITYPTENRVVNCQGYYDSQQVVNQCGYLDQASISLHEFSHATSVYAPGTDDVVYGIDGVLQLNTEQAKNNADSFAFYANSVFNNCNGDGSQSGGQNEGTITIPWQQGQGENTGSGSSQTGDQTGVLIPWQQGQGEDTGSGSSQTGDQTGGVFIPWQQAYGQQGGEALGQGNGQGDQEQANTGIGGLLPWSQQENTAPSDSGYNTLPASTQTFEIGEPVWSY
ncbi:Deuterolysin metalloprotease family-domain-containing protein [Aspergillus avenaceus]|uniref:Neutral protease 2 n=1 Tax=Aspergillus avenaceus TaxID=36643 RepID=A0A5N6U4M1_ASPAV|nr:Deuterolysin metalloprotease family-domain-containing protein [Aspergillus avenaceus]